MIYLIGFLIAMILVIVVKIYEKLKQLDDRLDFHIILLTDIREKINPENKEK